MEDGTEEAEDGLKSGDESRLEALRFNWGEAYEIEAWRARRRDGLGGWIEARDPDELGQAIADDYAVKPVPRDAGTQP